MVCNKCYAQNPDHAKFCQKCGTPLQNAESFQEASASQQTYTAPQNESVYQQPNPSIQPPRASAPKFMKKEYTWGDICTVVGFISSLVGLFSFWLILCPAGLVTSIIGYRSNRTRGLAVAGIIIASLGILIKIGYILYSCHLLPSWLTSGVF